MRSKDDYVAWGISTGFFGMLLLCKQWGLLNALPGHYITLLTEWRALLLYIAISFLIVKREKNTGLCFLVAALLVRFDQVYAYLRWMESWWYPLFFLTVGISCLYQGLFRRK